MKLFKQPFFSFTKSFIYTLQTNQPQSNLNSTQLTQSTSKGKTPPTQDEQTHLEAIKNNLGQSEKRPQNSPVAIYMPSHPSTVRYSQLPCSISTMLLKNIAILSLAAFVVANEAAPVEHNIPAVTDHVESPEDIHKLKEKMMEKKCPKPSCKKSIVFTTTCYHTHTQTVTKSAAKKCAPTANKKSCGKGNC